MGFWLGFLCGWVGCNNYCSGWLSIPGWLSLAGTGIRKPAVCFNQRPALSVGRLYIYRQRQVGLVVLRRYPDRRNHSWRGYLLPPVFIYEIYLVLFVCRDLCYNRIFISFLW